MKNSQMFLGGVKDFKTNIYDKAGQVSTHDFVGCMRSVSVDNQDLLTFPETSSNGTSAGCKRQPGGLCVADTCSKQGACVDQWTHFQCHCQKDFMGQQCEKGKF